MLEQSSTCLGGCHCGSVRFRVSIDRCLDARSLAPDGDAGSHRFIAEDCNSICRKKGFLHLIVPQANFELLQGQNCLTTYTFNTKVARHTFCSICGIHAFYTPRSHPNMIDVNVRCLDRDITDMLTIRAFDGQNWEDNVAQIRD